ncbi:MAG: hypothetical protein BMS9Abin02_1254 [Anaerolineae bacterium]|nr:MAG: hypothetical protein BMS9Abin02_1254 [Anaerolineae bacterium]
MNILVVSNIPPFVKGGAETQARFLAERFAERGHYVVVLGNNVQSDKIGYRGKEIRTQNIPALGWAKSLRAISYVVSLSVYILWHRRRFDVIYCRFVREAALTISMLKSLIPLSIRLVSCTACAGDMGDAAYVRRLPFSKCIISILNRHCDVINNISPATAEEFIVLGISRDRLRYIPNGIQVANSCIKKAQNPTRAFVYLGRLTRQKGLLYLLKAFNRVKRAGYRCSLHIIGDGPDRNFLEDVVRELELVDYVTFHGHIDNDQIAGALGRYDIMVMPSLYEGFCTAVIEAMNVGLPVIVTRSGGPEYFVDDVIGRVCDSGSVNKLAESMIELLMKDDEELLGMGRAAHERVRKKFDIERVADEYIELFRLLLNRG